MSTRWRTYVVTFVWKMHKCSLIQPNLLSQHRSAAGVVQLNGRMFALGGHNGLSIFDSVEVLAFFTSICDTLRSTTLRQNAGQRLCLCYQNAAGWG